MLAGHASGAKVSWDRPAETAGRRREVPVRVVAPTLPNRDRKARRGAANAPIHCRRPWRLQRSSDHSPSRYAQGVQG